VLKQQGLSYKEIAETLSLNEGSIGQFVARARKEFVRFYGKIGRETL
jgi:DNA-directed RNA polymerase specialized sigma24 family protein